MKIFLPAILLLLLCSCVDFNKSKYVERIESLELKIQDLEIIMSDFDNDSIISKSRRILDIETRIKKNCLNDTLSLDRAIQIDKFKNLRLDLDKMGEDHIKVDQELKGLKNNIAHLKNDIEKSVGDRANYDANITFEEDKVNQLTDFVEKYESKWQVSMETFHNLQPALVVYANKLEHKNREQFLLEN